MSNARPDFFADADRTVLAAAGLDDFEALWNLALPAVDAPNTERGGQSLVCQLELPDGLYYLKRQTNHLTRSLSHPLGEPTFSREFRNILRFKARGVPALEAAFYGERHEKEGQRAWRAILLTHALDVREGWQCLDDWLSGWTALAEPMRQEVLTACGKLARTLHGARLVHGSFYPKHIFLCKTPEGFTARLIDLEKTRRLIFPTRDRIKDLEQFVRHAPVLLEAGIRFLLSVYLDAPPDSRKTENFLGKLRARQMKKESRG